LQVNRLATVAARNVYDFVENPIGHRCAVLVAAPTYPADV
jgi:hypothetical protein